MADTKISALTELAAAPDDADELPIVDDSASATKRISVANLLAGETLSKVIGRGMETTGTLSGTTPTLEVGSSGQTVYEWTLSGNSTPTDSLADGESLTLLIDDGTAYTITWPTMEWVGGSAPTLDTTNTTIVVLVKVGTTLIGVSPGTAS
jgi:hypothetical protein